MNYVWDFGILAKYSHLFWLGLGWTMVYTVGSADSVDISTLLKRLSELSIVIKDLQTHQSSLEDIFVELVSPRS